jgi:hypothetical protein
VREGVGGDVERGQVDSVEPVTGEVVARVHDLPGRTAEERRLLGRLDVVGAG